MREREEVTMSVRSCFGTMKARCRDQSHKNYARYGGVGIEVRFNNVGELADAVGKRPGKNYTIDRIDPHGHYEAGNVRWATMREQNNNRHNSIWLTVEGVTKPLTHWADQIGLPRQLLWYWWHNRPGLAEKVIRLEVEFYSGS